MKIGLVIHHAEDSSGGPPSYAEMRAMAQTADSGGLDSIWIFDHLLFRHDPAQTEGIWEGWTLLSGLAEATDRVELGTLVLCNPFRNPALLAKMAHTLDEVSGGRLILGLGAGWHEPEFTAFGFPFDHRVGRFEEALQIVPPLLRGETVTFEGSYYRVDACVVTPLGPRPQGIPLLVGGRRPRMLRLVARYADLWNTAWLGEAHELPPRLARIQAACAEVGRDPDTLAITAGVQVAYPDLGPTNYFTEKPLGGPAEVLAEAFQAYAALGVAHVIVHLTPPTLAGVERLAAAVTLYRQLDEP
ncbi:MAG: LLM class flavin-dependent oxidoreductase [Candidatus Promineifilaceae bacterium]